MPLLYLIWRNIILRGCIAWNRQEACNLLLGNLTSSTYILLWYLTIETHYGTSPV